MTRGSGTLTFEFIYSFRGAQNFRVSVAKVLSFVYSVARMSLKRMRAHQEVTTLVV